MAAKLVNCLVVLRSEVDEIAPERDRSSDGWIGDSAHQSGTSDHNNDETGNVPIHDADSTEEVHAIDIDVDLRVPGLTMAMIVAFLVGRCRAGLEKRLRYIIFNRTIWSASWGWTAREYTGSNDHTKHAHFSASYDTAKEADGSAWELTGEFGLMTTLDDIKAKLDEIRSAQKGLHLQDQGEGKRSDGTAYGFFQIRDQLSTLINVVRELVTKDTVDEAALARDLGAALVPAVVAGVMEILPENGADITQEEVTIAVRTAFRDAFGAPAA